MPFLSNEEIRDIVSAVTSSELSSERDALLANINSEYKAGLPQTNAPSAQILVDLGAMNRTEELVDGTLASRRRQK
jgi:hypothetical protein